LKKDKKNIEETDKIEFKRISDLKQEYHRQTELLKPIKY
jgi:hypothetical protein